MCSIGAAGIRAAGIGAAGIGAADIGAALGPRPALGLAFASIPVITPCGDTVTKTSRVHP